MTRQTDAPGQDRRGASDAGGGALHSQDTARRRQRCRVSARVVVDLTGTVEECSAALRDASTAVRGRHVILRTGAVGPAGLRASELLNGAASIEIHGGSQYPGLRHYPGGPSRPLILDLWRHELETLA